MIELPILESHEAWEKYRDAWLEQNNEVEYDPEDSDCLRAIAKAQRDQDLRQFLELLEERKCLCCERANIIITPEDYQELKDQLGKRRTQEADGQDAD
ncbi:MAG: hypothetical protein KKD44_27200 [Proteobacteria bacterium]|nr:hypothetical protein [Pseudomonadota bacterium]